MISKVLFDLDGTLFHTQKTHAEIESRLVRQLCGISVDPESISRRFAGRATQEVFMELTSCSADDAQILYEIKWRLLLGSKEKSTPTIHNLKDFLLSLRRSEIEIAIGTASPREWAHKQLHEHNLVDVFEECAIVGGDMVEHGKPAPDIWVRAAGETSPEHCLVVEDGIAGIDAAIIFGASACLLLPERHRDAFPIRDITEIRNYL